MRYCRPLRSDSNPLVSVYALIDPVDGTVRYIGRTRDTKQRLTGHLCARPSSNRRRYKWIRELKKRGLVPRLVVLERCKLRKAPAAEEQWIQYHRPSGTLFNGTAKNLTKLRRSHGYLQRTDYYL